MSKGNLYVVSGPSGAGKSTICRLVRKMLGINLATSATTREPRVGEVDGRDYYFLTKEDEGNRLRLYFMERIEVLESKIEEIKKFKDIVVSNYKTKLLERLEKIKEEVEFKEEDILKEILLFTDKSDISEEISRLDSHLTQLKLEMNSSEIAIGKKIDFILQEIFRELNTTGVKCNLYDISKLVVESKNELEKIREQAMNIE